MIAGDKEFAMFAKKVNWSTSVFSSQQLETFLVAAIMRYFYKRTTQTFVLLLAKAMYEEKSSFLSSELLDFTSLLTGMKDIKPNIESSKYIDQAFQWFLKKHVASVTIAL